MRRRGRTSRPSSRVEARDVARQRRQNRFDRPPSWRSAFNRAILAAGVFFALLLVVLKQKFAPSFSLALVMLAVYVPMGYVMDKSLYRIRQRRKQRQTDA